MPFCRARLSAKRFIAGVGGNAPWPLPTVAPSKGGPPAARPSLSLPMMRSATLHTASIATDHLLLADNDIVEQAFKLRRHPRIDQRRVGLFENTEQRQASLGRHDVLSLGNRETR
jgi:hypothetical protein